MLITRIEFCDAEKENHCRVVSIEGKAKRAVSECEIAKNKDSEVPLLFLLEKVKYWKNL